MKSLLLSLREQIDLSRPHILGQAAAFEAVMAAPDLCILLLLPCEDLGAGDWFHWQLERRWDSTGHYWKRRAGTLGVMGVVFSQTDNHVLFFFNKNLFAYVLSHLPDCSRCRGRLDWYP